MRKTKIVCTIGPASDTVETIKNLINAGLDAARLNFSHGDHESHGRTIANIKKSRKELNSLTPIILDTKGPEIRLKKFKEPITLEVGGKFTLTTRQDVEGDKNIVAVTYEGLASDIEIGSRILIDDGLVELVVEKIKDTEIICKVINSGKLSSNKGVNIPDVVVNLPSLTEKDIEDIKFGIVQGVDFIAASFIRTARDVINIREVLEDNNGSDIRIISKIENREGVDNIDEILEVSDGIMVARGDLGVEIPPEEVPLVQKVLIRKAREAGKTVITATQMLESMINNPRPTRAEANDVANAIFDGTDTVMLSGETANGSYPVETVAMMSRIANKTESSIDYIKDVESHLLGIKTNITNAIAYAACTTASDLQSPAIITITNSGITPRSVSKFRPNSIIFALTDKEQIARQLNLTWGCKPNLAKKISGENIFDDAVEMALEKGYVKKGDYVVIAAGVPVGVAGSTNLLKVTMVGDIIVTGRGIGKNTVSGISNVVKYENQRDISFRKGDILIAKKTTDELIPYIKKASALIVGSTNPQDLEHAETVAKTLDIPVIICNEEIIDIIPNRSNITVDSKNGFVYYGNIVK